VRALEAEWAVLQAIRQFDAAHPVDVVEVTEGIGVRGLRRRWAVVVRAHGSDWTFRHYCDNGLGPADRWLIRQQRKQLSAAHAVSAISKHLADHLADFCRFPRQRIRVIPYPVDEGWHTAGSECMRAPQDETAVMAVGRLEKRKGTDQLVRAMVQVWKRYPQTRLYLAGLEIGFSRESLLGMVPENCRQRVRFLGFVARDRLREYYRRITAYVAPTRYETFGYTILEAMASGLPVISTFAGAIPELVEEGVNGFLTAPDDVAGLAARISMVVERPDLASAMAANSRKKAAFYALPLIGPALEDLYETARASRGARG
jgi:glycosyltransferase involved in cell wall biosynthesis